MGKTWQSLRENIPQPCPWSTFPPTSLPPLMLIGTFQKMLCTRSLGTKGRGWMGKNIWYYLEVKWSAVTCGWSPTLLQGHEYLCKIHLAAWAWGLSVFPGFSTGDGILETQVGWNYTVDFHLQSSLKRWSFNDILASKGYDWLFWVIFFFLRFFVFRGGG